MKTTLFVLATTAIAIIQAILAWYKEKNTGKTKVENTEKTNQTIHHLILIIGIIAALLAGAFAIFQTYEARYFKKIDEEKEENNPKFATEISSSVTNGLSEQQLKNKELYEKWASYNGFKKDYPSRSLDGASGRHLSRWYEIKVEKKPDGSPIVVVSFQGKCRSNNLIIGAQGTFRLTLRGDAVDSVSADCGPRGDSGSSSVKNYTLTQEQIVLYSPDDISLSADYK